MVGTHNATAKSSFAPIRPAPWHRPKGRASPGVGDFSTSLIRPNLPMGGALRLAADAPQRLGRGDDVDAVKVFEIKQVGVAGDDQIGARSDRTGNA